MMDIEPNLQTTALNSDEEYFEPDGLESRLLPTVKGGGLCHCSFPVGKASAPVTHRKMEEIWYLPSGGGEVRRKNSEAEATVPECAGSSLTIPPCLAFQLQNTGDRPLCILMVTMPPWPSPQEVEKIKGVWTVAARSEASAAPAMQPERA